MTKEAIAGAGLGIHEIRTNPYEFISERAQSASRKYGVKSVSLLATKPPGTALSEPKGASRIAQSDPSTFSSHTPRHPAPSA
jgi:hypothetical protein